MKAITVAEAVERLMDAKADTSTDWSRLRELDHLKS